MAPNNRNEMTHLHLSYLQQVSQLLGDHQQHKPLAARLGYIAKKISQKHVVHMNGADLPKLLSCKACQTPVSLKDVQTKRKKLTLLCPSCGLKRKYGVSTLCPTTDGKQKQQQQK